VSIEQNVNRANTAAFIAARPSSIVLIPSVRTKTASGGTRSTDGTPRAAQTLRIVEQTTNAGNTPGRLPAGDGHEKRVSWLLLGAWDALMDVGDRWTDAFGAGYQIEELLPFNGYERRARVVEYGGQ
jgi:hypothetical protein